MPGIEHTPGVEGKLEGFGGRKGEGEAGSLPNRSSDVGLNSRTWDRDVGQREMLNQLSHPGAPVYQYFQKSLILFGFTFYF